MRASRLINILAILQARGFATAPELAEECAVNLRTIYRDIDAMSEAGIPIYSERGSGGGYRLLDGYRTQLNGLSAKEAEALFMSGLAGAASDMGLGSVMMAAQNKLLSAMPASLREGALEMRSRFHLDAPSWFSQSEQPQYLPLVADAVWEHKRIQIRYQSWKGMRERTVEPLGMVMKAGSWYLVAQVDELPRTYRISRIQEIVVLDERFQRPGPFDLAAYWRKSTERLERDMHRNMATLRLSPMGVKWREHFLSPYAFSEMQLSTETDAEGWCTATMPVGSLLMACADILRFGNEAEVLEPPELRQKVMEAITGMKTIYKT
ncbi:helix-turn-helix transcriptional regulator [Undibacterium pigrum]|uniref:Putative DNA-binding transcriptional regulator YafY n=1 Tax=Undibacterium pigrum TaxID=401470 RepID=A0A318IZA4_9BURK|nr:YafY family protein [Undibacterium pigrum]PXX39800.1 putative DNA-binding transcriptional regulator YafY [Undibacterium pigrum]